MVTVVNNPAPKSNEGGGGFLVGVIFLIGFVMVLLYFGIPAIKNMNAPQIVIPNKIDVNVKQAK
jgi:hypothetical protein